MLRHALTTWASARVKLAHRAKHAGFFRDESPWPAEVDSALLLGGATAAPLGYLVSDGTAAVNARKGLDALRDIYGAGVRLNVRDVPGLTLGPGDIDIDYSALSKLGPDDVAREMPRLSRLERAMADHGTQDGMSDIIGTDFRQQRLRGVKAPVLQNYADDVVFNRLRGAQDNTRRAGRAVAGLGLLGAGVGAYNMLRRD